MKIQFKVLVSFSVFVVFSVLSIRKSIEIIKSGVEPVSLRSLMNERNPASAVSKPLSTPGASVVIPAGQVAYLDKNINLDSLTIYGELHCDPKRAPESIEIKVKTLIVNGLFQCGTQSEPYPKKLTISLKPGEINPRLDQHYRGILVGSGGVLSLHGNRKNSGWLKINQNVLPGAQKITVEVIQSLGKKQRALAWSVGDQIAIGPSGFNPLEGEKFTITAINANTNEVSLDHPAQYFHWGEKQVFYSKRFGNVDLDERAEVANLTRSILIRADETNGMIGESDAEDAQIGGHIMVHSGGKAYLDSIELYKMGQAGILARYPLHWHFSGNVTGQYIKNSSIHHSYQRCVTVHQTMNLRVENNVCFGFKGHGYFLEDGNETGNQLIHNLAMMSLAPDQNKLLLASDDVRPGISEGQGRFPSVSCYWISNPKNTVQYNVASGCLGVGFWMSFEDKVVNSSGTVIAEPIREITQTFDDNTAHSSQVGITWDGAPGWESANNPNNPKDRKIASAHYAPPFVPVFKGNSAFKNSMTGIYFRGNTALFKNTVTADNGRSFWVGYHQIIRDSIFIGKTQNVTPEMNLYYYNKSDALGENNRRSRKAGIVLYDGPFEIHHSDFLNFSTQRETITLSNGKVIHSSVIPFTLTGGTNKFVNLTSGLQFEPEPIYRVHTEDISENNYGAQNLGNGSIRDLDGSLTQSQPGSSVVATRSLGILPSSGCQSKGDAFYNMKVCPPSYSEGSVTFMRWERSPWATPFLVRRSDGSLNYQMNEWSYAIYYNNPSNLFALGNSTNQVYEVLPFYNFAQNTSNPDPSKWIYSYMDSNAETLSFNPPVIRILAYGNNCKLEEGPIQVSSLAELKAANQSAYYSNGKDFYLRIFPNNWWSPITHSPFTTATAYTTMPVRHRILCDVQSPIPVEVTGRIEQVERGPAQTTISGWACNFTQENSINVDLYADDGIEVSAKDGVTPASAAPIFLKRVMSNLSPDPNLAFKCGKFSSKGRRFVFEISNALADQYKKKKAYVKGISNLSGIPDRFIGGSGRFGFDPRLYPSSSTESN
jgi:cell migration-inducing and hyaluronan-binding protein